MFGGLNGQIANNELWQLDLSPSPHWTQLAPAGTPPSPRYGHSLVYDTTRDRVLVFGGANGAGVPNGETWSLNLSGPMAWTQVHPTGTAPGPLYAHNAIYDPLRDRMVVYGGYNGNESGSAYALNLASASPNWLVLHPNGALPLPRLAAVGIYYPIADRFVVSGGNAYSVPPGGDTWALSWGDTPTPTLLSFVDCEAASDHVRLRWQASDAADLHATVERSRDGSGWTRVGVPLIEGTSLLVYEDRDVTAGRSWYRLAYEDGSLQRYTDPVSVLVPAGVPLALVGVRPNPATAGSAIEFHLPDTRPTQLELVDVRGRLIWSLEIGSLGAGAHSVPLFQRGALGAGVYWVRLIRPEIALTRKTVLMAP